MTTCNANFCFNCPSIKKLIIPILKKFKSKLKLQKNSQQET